MPSVIDDLKRDEGWRPEPYQDHLGYWTIGYGFLIDPKKPVKLPAIVGEIWLATLVEEREKALFAAIPWLAGQPEEIKRALVNMAYQLGISGLLRFKKMLDALRAGRRDLAAVEALSSTWATQAPARAQRVAALIRGRL